MRTILLSVLVLIAVAVGKVYPDREIGRLQIITHALFGEDTTEGDSFLMSKGYIDSRVAVATDIHAFHHNDTTDVDDTLYADLTRSREVRTWNDATGSYTANNGHQISVYDTTGGAADVVTVGFSGANALVHVGSDDSGFVALSSSGLEVTAGSGVPATYSARIDSNRIYTNGYLVADDSIRSAIGNFTTSVTSPQVNGTDSVMSAKVVSSGDVTATGDIIATGYVGGDSFVANSPVILHGDSTIARVGVNTPQVASGRAIHDTSRVGAQVYTPGVEGDIEDAAGITAAMLGKCTYMRIGAKGGESGTVTATPSIADGMYDGHILILEGYDSNGAGDIILQDETQLAGSGLILQGNTDMSFRNSGTLMLVYSGTKDKWVEISRSDN